MATQDPTQGKFILSPPDSSFLSLISNNLIEVLIRWLIPNESSVTSKEAFMNVIMIICGCNLHGIECIVWVTRHDSTPALKASVKTQAADGQVLMLRMRFFNHLTIYIFCFAVTVFCYPFTSALRKTRPRNDFYSERKTHRTSF